MSADRSDALSVLQVLRPAAGGMLRHVADVVEGMADRGIRCTVAGPTRMLRSLPGTLTVSVDVPICSSAHPVLDPVAVARVVRAARAHALIHAHGLRAAWIAGWAARLSQTPMVMTAHNVPECTSGMRRWALIRSVQAARRVVAVSHAVAGALVECGTPRERIEVLPNGVRLTAPGEIASRPDHGFGPDAFVVVGAGRMSWEKGFDILIEAMRHLSEAHSQARLVLCGAGTEQAALAARAEAAGVSDRVRFAGYVPDLAVWLSVADLVAVPSRTEGQGLVALEAMALGRPVVASNVGGLPEVIEDGVSGLLVPPEDPATLAAALRRLADDPALRQKLGAAGRRRVEEQFSLDAMLDRLADLYRSAGYPR